MTLTSRRGLAILAVLAVAVLSAGILLAYAPWRQPSEQPALEGRGGPKATEPAAGEGEESEEELNEEAEEQAEGTEKRTEAFEAAKRQGKVGQQRPPGAAAAPGWVGEFPMDTQWDDWEPAIAADPSAPFVYALATRYAAPKPCPGNCPTPWIALEISTDGGATWSNPKALCACKGSGQFDPIIEVVPNTGAVYALYMNGFNIMFTKSTNHGTSWSAPVKTYGNVSWNDKPVIAVSNNGNDVYLSFNGPTGGDPYVAQSHNAGATWTQTKLVDSNRYFFAFDADVDNNGTVYFAETSILYGGGGNKGTTPSGAIQEHVFISRDAGATWENRTIASVQPGLACSSEACPPDYYLGHIALSADANGALVALYDGATTAGGLQRIESRRSTDGGRTWSAATILSAVGEEAVTPAVESRGSGDVRAWYYQTVSASTSTWNVWYRKSTDGGVTWTTPMKISDAAGGAVYKNASGFAEVYGDYGELSITSAGKSIAIWGEGISYAGPGGVWFNREQ